MVAVYLTHSSKILFSGAGMGRFMVTSKLGWRGIIWVFAIVVRTIFSYNCCLWINACPRSRQGFLRL